MLDRNLAGRRYVCGYEYTIADSMATWPWYGSLVLDNLYEAHEFLDVASQTHVARWATEIRARPAVQRGRRVKRTGGRKRNACRNDTTPATSRPSGQAPHGAAEKLLPPTG